MEQNGATYEPKPTEPQTVTKAPKHKVLGKVFEAGFTDEKSIAAMTMDDILAIQGITIADIGIINELQKSIKANKVISFFGGNAE